MTGRQAGFEGMVAEIALGQVGIILALEASRLARDNAAWYRLLDLAGVCDTLVADADGVYHPALFNDRLVLGMKGIMSEAELHVLRARLEGGIKNKAARGELRRGLPVGLVWGEADGEICFHPDEAVTGVITAVFGQFAACGSVRATWLWLRGQRLRWPLQKVAYTRRGSSGYRRSPGVDPTYHAVHTTLTHPPILSAYIYGRTRNATLTPRRRAAPAQPMAPRPVGGPHPRSPPGVHRLGHLPGQPGPHRRQHPAAGQPARHRRGPEGCALLQEPSHLRHVRPQARDLLCRPGQMRAELLLPGIGRAGRRARRPAHERRRAGHRRRRRGRVPGRAGARRAGCVPASRPPARRRPRRRAGPAPAPG